MKEENKMGTGMILLVAVVMGGSLNPWKLLI